MARLSELVAYADRLLAVENFSDYCPNGLQVQGRSEVKTLVGGVTACQALLAAAVERRADAVLVHHGYFWKGEDPRITGMKQRRLATLLRHDISLIAYHLPLDAHPELGNNAQLGRMLDLTVTGAAGRRAPDMRANRHQPPIAASQTPLPSTHPRPRAIYRTRANAGVDASHTAISGKAKTRAWSA